MHVLRQWVTYTLCVHEKDRELSDYVNLNALGFKCSVERRKPRTVLYFDIFYKLEGEELFEG